MYYNRRIVESSTPPENTEMLWLNEGKLYSFKLGEWTAIAGGGGGDIDVATSAEVQEMFS